MKKVAIVLGTRPEAIKLLPIYSVFKNNQNGLEPILISTGQHKEMLLPLFALFDVAPDYELSLMTKGQTLESLTSKLFSSLGSLVKSINPDLILVQGDTTTALVGAMLAYYNKIKIGHIEAGLRTYDKYSPFPEEMNRKWIGNVADLHFAPTQKAMQVLEKESLKESFLVGNTVIDSLLYCKGKIEKNISEFEERYSFLGKSKLVLITGHRRESFGKGFDSICDAIAELSIKYNELRFVYPVHLNPNVREVVHKKLSGAKKIHLIEPLPYEDLIYLMSKSILVMTDSGGIQEEAPSLDLPVIVMRNTTERKEGLEAGCSILAGTQKESLINAFESIYPENEKYYSMKRAKNPFGDGKSSEKIVEIIGKSLS